MSSRSELEEFRQAVWRYYDRHGRHDLPWRLPADDGGFDPYRIMVSELMLQQTQVNRVIPKFLAFIEQFPAVEALAEASLAEVLIAWQGLGYNRRAMFLHQAAQMVVGELGGQFPREQKELTKLPGVGMNTAGAIMAYAYDQPAVFIETNIRTVYIHHFFDDQTDVPDKAVAELVERTLPKGEVGGRLWYWALMDYGTHIKQLHGNKSRASRSYAKQSPFEGSKRQVRGAVIRQLSQGAAAMDDLSHVVEDARLAEVLTELVREGLVQNRQGRYSLD